MGTELKSSPNFSSSKTSSTVLALGVIAALLGGAFAGAAGAEAPPPAPAQAVSYADLDLSQPAGAEALLVRITAAAKDACGGAPDNSPLYPRSDYQFRTCTSEAVDAAIARINKPALTALANPAKQPVQSPVGALASR